MAKGSVHRVNCPARRGLPCWQAVDCRGNVNHYLPIAEGWEAALRWALAGVRRSNRD